MSLIISKNEILHKGSLNYKYLISDTPLIKIRKIKEQKGKK